MEDKYLGNFLICNGAQPKMPGRVEPETRSLRNILMEHFIHLTMSSLIAFGAKAITYCLNLHNEVSYQVFPMAFQSMLHSVSLQFSFIFSPVSIWD